MTASDLDLSPPLQQYTNILVSLDLFKKCSSIILEILRLMIAAPIPLADLGSPNAKNKYFHDIRNLLLLYYYI